MFVSNTTSHPLPRRARSATHVAVCVGLVVLMGCHARQTTNCPSPVSMGLNVRDMIDKQAQAEAQSMYDLPAIAEQGEKLRQMSFEQGVKDRNPNAPLFREKNILCLSGGGSYGAYTAGVLCGWTARGDRPEFDVVTGISSGALIAPFAFLGPAYDEQVKRFYTTLESKDLYDTHYVRGLFTEALADNAKLAARVDAVLTPQLLCDLAREHQKGRRLYVGTTAVESKRFVVWDVGAIATGGRPEDRALIKQVLLASSAIPGFFPPQHITVSLDGRCLTERHVDGGVSQALFHHAPYVPPEARSARQNADLAGTNIYCIVAGKLYADAEVMKARSLTIAAKNVSTVIYAQTRGDLVRLYTVTLITGMNFYMTAIPAEYPAPLDSTAFEIPAMVGMFNEGFRRACDGTVWRRTPPGVEPGESNNERAGVNLNYEVRGPLAPPHPDKGRLGRRSPPIPLFPVSDQGIPAVAPNK